MAVERDEAAWLGEVLLARRGDADALATGHRRGVVERVRWGAYLPAAPTQGPARDTRRRMLARMAAVDAQLTVPHWFSHESAAVLWGCDTVRLPEAVHLLQDGRPARRGRDAVVRHHGGVPAPERATVHGLPVTSLERTVLDCASSLTPDRALVIADSALRRGADAETVGRLLVRRAGRRGVARARSVLALADGRAESPGETLVRLAVHDHGLPAPDLQIPVRTRRGRFRLDLGWTARHLAVEFDGFVKYSGASGSTAPEVVFAEKQRQDALEDEGWRILRVTWDDLRAPVTLATRIARALRRAPVEVEGFRRGRGRGVAGGIPR